MRILAIETSMDETAAAVVEKLPNGLVGVVAEAMATSEGMHIKTGGVVPEVAAREQLRSIIPVVREALARASNVQFFPWAYTGFSAMYNFPAVVPEVALNRPIRPYRNLDTLAGRQSNDNDQINTEKLIRWVRGNIDAVAVTVGPGMIGSLLTGVETAKALALAWEKPLIGVNHLQGHLFANFIGENHKHQISSFKPSSAKATEGRQVQNVKSKKTTNEIPKFPAIGLVVSGGHTDLVLMESPKEIKLLGQTRDDAAGECFDKCARLLKLGYPGGPAIEKAASECSMFNIQCSNKSQAPNSKLKLPRPLLHDESYDFSFSGLKVAVMREVEKFRMEKQITLNRSKLGTGQAEPLNLQRHREFVRLLAIELQEAVVEVLVAKVIRAVEEFEPKSVLLGGGVAANSHLRESLYVQCSMFNVQLFVPEVKYCTDNAVMIGAAAGYLDTPLAVEKVKADPGLEIV